VGLSHFPHVLNILLNISVYSANQPVDKVEFRPGDRLLGAGSFNGQAIFFSIKHGLVAVKLQQEMR
jgi:hypothetical protein